MPRLLPLALAAAVAAGGAFALHQAGRTAQADTPADATAAGPPPMPVPVAPVLVREMAETAEFTGFLHAARSVDLRPRVSGMIDTVEVPEGALAQPGQVLFRIDQRPYRAAPARAEAALAEAREREALAAQVPAAEAAVAAARLDLDFTVIAAPIAGRIGRAIATEGNLVTAGETLLAGIVSVDPMHVLFDVDEPTYLRLLAAAAEAGDAPVDIDLGLAGENGFPRRGRLDFLDNQADRATGTARLRAVLPNAAVVFTMLAPFAQRRTSALSANAIAQRLQAKLFGIQAELALVFPPPPVQGLGAVGGFKLQAQDRAGLGPEAKNAILAVEFAHERERAGLDPLAAVVEAARLRLRPILMTSIAFVAGAVPLAIATGAGAEMRRAMGIAVASGMAGVTLLGLLFTPVFYLLLRRLAQGREARAAPRMVEA